MNKFFSFIEKHPKIILVTIAVITIFFLVHAMKLSINADYSAFLPYGEPPEVFEGGKKIEANTIQAQVLDDEHEYIILESTAYNTIRETASINPMTDIATEPDYPYSSSYLVLIEADNLYQKDLLNILETCIGSLIDRREVGVPFSVFDFVTLEKKGTRLLTVPISTHPYGVANWTDEEVSQLEQRIKNDPNLRYYLVSNDGNSILFDFPIGGFNNAMLDEFSQAFDPFRALGGRVYTNGGAVINAKVMHYLQRDLITLVVLCLIVILITFYLCFRSKRSVIIPASLSVIGLIWTFGTMSLLGFQITLLSIVTPCMVITLGSAYSIHVINEYYICCKGQDEKHPVKAIKKIIKTITLASITTIGGFFCLAISRTSGLREFGFSVSIGIFYCAILASTYLPAILALTPIPTEKKIQKQNSGLMVKMINKLSTFVPKHWTVLLLVLITLFFGFLFVKDKISLDSNYMSYFPASDPFGQESKHFASKMGGTNPFYVTITAPNNEKNFFLQSTNLNKVWDFEQKITNESPDILQILSFPSYVSFAQKIMTGKEGIPETNGLALMLSRLIILMQNQVGDSLSAILNSDASSITLAIQHWDSINEDLMTTSSIARVNDLLIENLNLLPDNTTVTISGDPVVNMKFATGLFNDQLISTYLSILIVLLIGSCTFRSGIKGLYCIVPVVSGIFINYLFMYFAKIPFDIVTVSFTSIAVGCGVDDALHFMLRYSNLKKGNKNKTTKVLITDTLNETGRPIILTTISVVFGMLMLSFASYTPIRYFGLLMGVTLSGCMISTILFLPSVIILGNTLSTRFKSKWRKRRA